MDRFGIIFRKIVIQLNKGNENFSLRNRNWNRMREGIDDIGKCPENDRIYFTQIESSDTRLF